MESVTEEHLIEARKNVPGADPKHWSKEVKQCRKSAKDVERLRDNTRRETIRWWEEWEASKKLDIKIANLQGTLTLPNYLAVHVLG